MGANLGGFQKDSPSECENFETEMLEKIARLQNQCDLNSKMVHKRQYK